jgi:hypothetical protein
MDSYAAGRLRLPARGTRRSVFGSFSNDPYAAAYRMLDERMEMVSLYRSGATALFRPVGHAEAELIRESGLREFPPRVFWQPIFYPVTNYEYVCKIARDWNTEDAASGFVGHVTRFSVDTEFLSHYDVHQVGCSFATEYWISAEDLAEFNRHLVGPITFVATFRGEST